MEEYTFFVSVARVCKSFGMTVWGVTKSHVTSESASPYVDQYRYINRIIM